MANPQLEDGYTMIANEVIEALIQQNLSGQELRVVLLVLRKTYGYHKKEDYISLSQIGKFTGLSIVRGSQIMKSLQLKKIVTVTENINGLTKKYCFNKHFEKWEPLQKSVTLTEKCNPYRKMKATLTEKRNRPLQKNESTKETLTKETLTKERHQDFVLLTPDEYKKLKDKLTQPIVDNYISKLNNYIGSKGKKYKSHYFTILNWSNKDGIPTKSAENKVNYIYDSQKELEELNKKIEEDDKLFMEQEKNKMKKIPTIFKRNLENMRELLNEPHPDCTWVFEGKGIATRKYDGTCVKIEKGKYYKRREVKKGQIPPIGFIQEDFDGNTGKRVGWIEVDFVSKENRYHVEAFNSLYLDGTYELIGPKIQGNPEHSTKHILIKHSKAEKLHEVPRTYNELADYLRHLDIEGIVFHHPDGRMGKIKKRDFGQRRTR